MPSSSPLSTTPTYLSAPQHETTSAHCIEARMSRLPQSVGIILVLSSTFNSAVSYCIHLLRIVAPFVPSTPATQRFSRLKHLHWALSLSLHIGHWMSNDTASLPSSLSPDQGLPSWWVVADATKGGSPEKRQGPSITSSAFQHRSHLEEEPP